MIRERDWNKIKVEDFAPVNGTVPYAIIVYPEDGREIKLHPKHNSVVLKGYAVGDGETGASAKRV
jgi:hypothetical protein